MKKFLVFLLIFTGCAVQPVKPEHAPLILPPSSNSGENIKVVPKNEDEMKRPSEIKQMENEITKTFPRY